MESVQATSELPSNIVVPASTEAPESVKQNSQPTSRPHIQVAPPAASEDSTLVDALVTIINAVYNETEGDIFVDGYKRTNADEVRTFIQAGEIAVAYLPSTSEAGSETPIGCIRIQKLSPTLGEFGMMALEPQYRGGGFGRDMVLFAEEHCRSSGLTTMQVELLFPTEFEHPFKKRLFTWYTRMGYNLVRLGVFLDEYPQLAPLLRGPCEYRVFEKPLA